MHASFYSRVDFFKIESCILLFRRVYIFVFAILRSVSKLAGGNGFLHRPHPIIRTFIATFLSLNTLVLHTELVPKTKHAKVPIPPTSLPLTSSSSEIGATQHQHHPQKSLYLSTSRATLYTYGTRYILRSVTHVGKQTIVIQKSLLKAFAT